MIRWTQCDYSRDGKAYWDKRLEENWKNPYHGMYFNPEEEMAYMDTHNQEILRKYLRKYMGSSRCVRILELGCGNGRYVPFLKQAAKDMRISVSYCGIDYGTKSIEEAREIHKDDSSFGIVSFLDEDVRNAPDLLAGSTFDLIFMVSVLTSIEQDFIGTIEACAKLLRDDESRMFVMEQYWAMEHRKMKR